MAKKCPVGVGSAECPFLKERKIFPKNERASGVVLPDALQRGTGASTGKGPPPVSASTLPQHFLLRFAPGVLGGEFDDDLGFDPNVDAVDWGDDDWEDETDPSAVMGNLSSQGDSEMKSRFKAELAEIEAAEKAAAGPPPEFASEEAEEQAREFLRKEAEDVGKVFVDMLVVGNL